MVQKKLPLINAAHGSDTRNIINELIKLFNNLGYTYDEALQKAHDTLDEAERINNINNDTNNRLDNIIADSGTSSTEVVDARGEYTVLRNRMDAETAQLDEATENISSNLKANFKEMLKYPPGFSFPEKLRILKSTFGDFTVRDFDAELFHPLGKNDGKIYYISKGGDDQADGLTPDTAFRKLDKAFSMPDVDTVYIVAGEYGRQHAYGTNLPNRSIKVKALNGKVTVGTFEDPNPDIEWLDHGVGVYRFNRSAVENVYDTKNLNDFGNYSRYVKKSSLAEVEEEKGTWFVDSDDTLYVHTLDNKKPKNDEDIKVVVTGALIQGTHNKSYYFEGINFEFGTATLDITGASLVLGRDCSFSYAQSRNGLDIDEVDMTILQNCSAFENYADGFNYHADDWNDKYLHFIEVDCIGFRNGFSGTTMPNNNGSTSHVNCKGIRVNGLYFENFGPTVADVGSRNYIWNIGCTAYDSRQTPYSIDFLTENKMWLESCVSYNSMTSLYTAVEGAEIFIRNTKYLGSTFVKTEGNLIEYTQ